MIKINSLARVTDYLIREAGLPMGKFEVTTRRWKKASTSVVVFFVNKELGQSHVGIGKGIMSLTTDDQEFQRGLEILQENIYRPGMAVEVAAVPQPETEGKLVTRIIGEPKEGPAQTSREAGEADPYPVGSLEELDNLFEQAQSAPAGGKIEL